MKSPTSPRITNRVSVSDYIMDSKSMMFLALVKHILACIWLFLYYYSRMLWGLSLIFALESVDVLGVKGHRRVVYVLYKFSIVLFFVGHGFSLIFGFPRYLCSLFLSYFSINRVILGGKYDNIYYWWCVFSYQ